MATTTNYSPFGGAAVSGSAPHSFVPASVGGSVSSNVRFEWDFDNDGDFDQSVEDITHYVLAAQAARGRDYPSNLTGKATPGQLKLTLRNDDDRFGYFNTGSPLNASPFSLKTGRKIRVRANDGVLGAATITYAGIGAATSANNASLTPALPTGLLSASSSADGNADLVLILATIRNSGTGTVNAPTGWAKLLESGNVCVLGRYYEEGLAAPTVTFAGGAAGATTTAQAFAFRGVHQSLGLAISISAAQLNGSAQNVATPSLVVTENNNAVVVAGWKQTSWTSVATFGGATEISDTSSASGSTAAFAIDYVIQTTAATIGANALAVTGGVSAISRGLVFALRPAVNRADPVLLARDSFDRAYNRQMGTADTGQAWVNNGGNGMATAFGRAYAETGNAAEYGVPIVETVDVGTVDHYVQAMIPTVVQDGRVGIVARYLDASNYVRAYYDEGVGGFRVEELIAGSPTTVGSVFYMESWDGMTIGLRLKGMEAFIYVGGAPLEFSSRLYLSRPALTGTRAGLYALWQSHSDIPPGFDDFKVWDDVRGPLDGVIWTGTVKSVKTSVSAGDLKVVEVEAQGILAGAAGTQIAAPRILRAPDEYESSNSSVPAGCIVGDCMARAGLLDPPQPLSTYPISHIGAVALKDDKALSIARKVELAERGFIKETAEGGIAFEDRYYRDDLSSTGWWSDTTGVGQFWFEEIEPLDHEGQIINRAIAQASALRPTVVDVSNQGDDDTSLDVSILCPDVTAGQLVLVFIVCTSVQDERQWLKPNGWTQHRDVGDAEGTRIYSLIADGTESGAQYYFLKTEQQGTYIAHIYVIDNWYGTDDGIKVGRVSSGAVAGTNAYPVSPGWNRAPALYIVFQGVMGANSGILWDDLAAPPPMGYDYDVLEGLVFVTAPVAYETGVESVYKYDITDTEDPREWLGVFTDYLLLETVCVAVRGYNGPLSKPALDDAKAVGGDGIFAQADDTDSQLDHRFIRTNPEVPELLYSKAHAEDWCEEVLAEFSDDRPIISISFTASKNAQLRSQALRRRESDKITLDGTGRSGLGIQGDFHIEHIHHQWSKGTKLWVTTWECSPA
jgi:hypothetical protein